jgi:hypothetical protein
MSRVQYASGSFQQGFSCSQAVFSAFSELFGLEVHQTLKISQPFGGGSPGWA